MRPVDPEPPVEPPDPCDGCWVFRLTPSHRDELCEECEEARSAAWRGEASDKEDETVDGFEFDFVTHTYSLNGRTIPGVTQIVAPLGADADEPTDGSPVELAMEAAAERGTLLHQYIEYRLATPDGSPDDFELPEEYDPYADAVDLFLMEHDLAPYMMEAPLCTEEFAGTPDFVGQFDGADAVLDWKFVSSVAKSRVGAQLGGYAILCEAEAKIFPDALAAVQFLPTGGYRLYKADTDEAKKAFGIAKALYDIKVQKHPRGAIFKKEGG